MINMLFAILAESQTNFFTVTIHRNIFRRKRSHLIRNIHHRTAICNQFLVFLRRTLRTEHIIRELRLPECIHNSSIKRIGMISPLMIEGMPQTTSHVLSGSSIQYIIARIFIIGVCISLRLYQHRHFSPDTVHTTRRIMRIPVIHIISPFPGKVTNIGIQSLRIKGPSSPHYRMSEMDRKMFVSTCRNITAGITIWIRIFLIQYIYHIFSKLCRIPGFI